MEAMEARLNLYKAECKETGKELMISGMKLKSPHGEILNKKNIFT